MDKTLLNLVILLDKPKTEAVITALVQIIIATSKFKDERFDHTNYTFYLKKDDVLTTWLNNDTGSIHIADGITCEYSPKGMWVRFSVDRSLACQ